MAKITVQDCIEISAKAATSWLSREHAENLDQLHAFCLRFPNPNRHTHTYCFPVFEERRVDALPVHVGFRCECGEIRNDGF